MLDKIISILISGKFLELLKISWKKILLAPLLYFLISFLIKILKFLFKLSILILFLWLLTLLGKYL
jgi:hypothetical protein